jgi:hypothetical protein
MKQGATRFPNSAVAVRAVVSTPAVFENKLGFPHLSCIFTV